jgi:hypothetical protein
MTTESVAHPAQPARPALPAGITRPAAPPGTARAGLEVARRALRKYYRTPGLWAMGVVQSVLFLFAFRYVFGGYITGGASRYADFFVPGYVATIVLFTGGGIAVAVAEDHTSGFTGRLLSLPVPRLSIVAGRAATDFLTNGWSILVTASAWAGPSPTAWPRSGCACSTAWCSRWSSWSWA